MINVSYNRFNTKIIESPRANGPNINNDLNEVAEDYSRNIFRNLFKQF